jgi:hypothetical protein
MPNDDERTLLGTLVTWMVVAVVAIAVLKLAFWTLGVALGMGVLAVSIALRLLPLLIVGWIAVKLYRVFFRRGDDAFDTV